MSEGNCSGEDKVFRKLKSSTPELARRIRLSNCRWVQLSRINSRSSESSSTNMIYPLEFGIAGSLMGVGSGLRFPGNEFGDKITNHFGNYKPCMENLLWRKRD